MKLLAEKRHFDSIVANGIYGGMKSLPEKLIVLLEGYWLILRMVVGKAVEKLASLRWAARSMKADAQAKFSLMLSANGSGLVMRLIAGSSVGRVHWKVTASTYGSGGVRIVLLQVSIKSTVRKSSVVLRVAS
jgi:hypothetical protein